MSLLRRQAEMKLPIDGRPERAAETQSQDNLNGMEMCIKCECKWDKRKRR